MWILCSSGTRLTMRRKKRRVEHAQPSDLPSGQSAGHLVKTDLDDTDHSASILTHKPVPTTRDAVSSVPSTTAYESVDSKSNIAFLYNDKIKQKQNLDKNTQLWLANTLARLNLSSTLYTNKNSLDTNMSTVDTNKVNMNTSTIDATTNTIDTNTNTIDTATSTIDTNMNTIDTNTNTIKTMEQIHISNAGNSDNSKRKHLQGTLPNSDTGQELDTIQLLGENLLENGSLKRLPVIGESGKLRRKRAVRK